MGLCDLFEARRNPDVNKKIHPFDQLKSIAKKYPDAYVTYTMEHKVGVNPQSKYATPLGIYAYPIKYVIRNKMRVPFPEVAAYCFIFEPKDPSKIKNIIGDINQMKDQIDDAIKQVLGKLYTNKGTKNTEKRLKYIIMYIIM